MLIFTTPEEVRNWLSTMDISSTRGFVPTMGALHRGHEALFQTSLSENDVTMLSIFVNPTQFDVESDYENYPSHITRDLALAKHHGIDMVFMPSVETMFPKSFGSFIEPGSTSHTMEGLHRPGHFRGVTTVVAKLFNIVQPQRAYFGKKDFQQLSVIRQMVSELNYPIDIIGIDTVRESDGLALSSRNQRLNSQQRTVAPKIYETLVACQALVSQGVSHTHELTSRFSQSFESTPFAKVEYATVCDAQTLENLTEVNNQSILCVAVWYGDVRLIDNIEL